MGGKNYQTTTNLEVVDVYKDDNTMYMKEMLRIFAFTKRINARYMGAAVNNAAGNYYNGDKLEALGGAVKNTAITNSANKSSLVKWNYDSNGVNYSFPLIFVTHDANGKSCSFNAKKLKDTLGSIYTVDNTYSKTFTYDRSFDSDQSPGGGYATYLKGVSGIDVAKTKWITNSMIGSSYDDGSTCTFTPVRVTDDHTFSFTLPAYVINGNSYLLKSDTIANNKVTMELATDPTQTIEINVPIDNRRVYIVRFALGLNYPEFASCGITYTGLSGYYDLFKSDFLGEYSEANFLLFPMMHNFEKVNNEGYREVLLGTFGLNNGDLQDSISDPNNNVKSALISYTTKWYEEPYKDVIQEVYGEDLGNTVVFQSEFYHLEYQAGINFNGDNFYNITYDGVSQNIDPANDKAYMVPIDFITYNMGTRQKYDELDNLMSIVMAQSQTVKLQWYQTAWVDFVGMVIAFALAYATSGTSIALYMAGKVVAQAVELGYIDSRTGTAIMTILSIASLFVGGVKISGWSWFSSAFNLSAAIATDIYITQPMIELEKDIKKKSEDTAKINEVLAAIRENQLYIPFDTYDMPAAALYDLPYNAYSTAQDGMYDYDNKFATTGRIT